MLFFGTTYEYPILNMIQNWDRRLNLIIGKGFSPDIRTGRNWKFDLFEIIDVKKLRRVKSRLFYWVDENSLYLLYSEYRNKFSRIKDPPMQRNDYIVPQLQS